MEEPTMEKVVYAVTKEECYYDDGLNGYHVPSVLHISSTLEKARLMRDAYRQKLEGGEPEDIYVVCWPVDGDAAIAKGEE